MSQEQKQIFLQIALCPLYKREKRIIMNTTNQSSFLQGRVQFPTGGKAREPKGMIRCNSEADSIVWMKEDKKYVYGFLYALE